jgi:hypothetical protein
MSCGAAVYRLSQNFGGLNKGRPEGPTVNRHNGVIGLEHVLCVDYS